MPSAFSMSSGWASSRASIVPKCSASDSALTKPIPGMPSA